MSSATFTKGERLSSYKEIQALMQKGETFFHYPFKVVFRICNRQHETGQEKKSAIMVSVPKRNFKRAVKRNLLKRRIRESYRLNKNLLAIGENEYAHILFVYVSKEIMDFAHIETKLKDILATIAQKYARKEQQDEQEQV